MSLLCSDSAITFQIPLSGTSPEVQWSRLCFHCRAQIQRLVRDLDPTSHAVCTHLPSIHISSSLTSTPKIVPLTLFLTYTGLLLVNCWNFLWKHSYLAAFCWSKHYLTLEPPAAQQKHFVDPFPAVHFSLTTIPLDIPDVLLIYCLSPNKKSKISKARLFPLFCSLMCPSALTILLYSRGKISICWINECIWRKRGGEGWQCC